jgi:polypeptide N-acetylgalactosaminyltransferase
MLGCAFAINRQFYWDLGAYDEELMIWNGQSYELSFKLWLCGGSLLEVLCSRVAHTFRTHNEYRKMEGVKDFLSRNFKRIAEVWFDEYKEALYRHAPERYRNTDAGDLTKLKLIRERLKCKPFKYFLDVVAPDLLERFPAYPKPNFASGAIISVAKPTLCIDTVGRPNGQSLGLYGCHSNLVHPAGSQNFQLTWQRNIKRDDSEDCLDAYNAHMSGCHYSLFGNQYWRYHMVGILSIKIQENLINLIAHFSELKQPDPRR